MREIHEKNRTRTEINFEKWVKAGVKYEKIHLKIIENEVKNCLKLVKSEKN